jgi:hypothetical protein
MLNQHAVFLFRHALRHTYRINTKILTVYYKYSMVCGLKFPLLIKFQIPFTLGGVPTWLGWIGRWNSLFYLLSTWSTWSRIHTWWEFSKNRKFSYFYQITKKKKPKNIILSSFLTFIYFRILFLFLRDLIKTKI